jgi:hypothetical protein
VDNNPSDFYSAVLAQILCFLNAALGYIISVYAYGKKFEKFISIVMGSMFLRIMAIGVFSWWALTQYGVAALSYSISLAFGVFIYLFIEIFYFHFVSEKIKVRDSKK